MGKKEEVKFQIFLELKEKKKYNSQTFGFKRRIGIIQKEGLKLIKKEAIFQLFD